MSLVDTCKWRICAVQQGRDDPEEGTCKNTAQSSDRRTERSREQSRKLILEWADELHCVNKVGARGRIEISHQHSQQTHHS